MKKNPSAKKKPLCDFAKRRIDTLPLFQALDHPDPKIALHPRVLQAAETARTFIASHEDTVQLALSKAAAHRSRKPQEVLEIKSTKKHPTAHLDFYKAISTGRARHLPDEMIFAHLIKKQLEKGKLGSGEALETILTIYKRFGFSDTIDALKHLYQFIHINSNVVTQITAEEAAEIAKEKKRVSILKKEHQQLNLSAKAQLANNIQHYKDQFEHQTKRAPNDRDALVHGILATIRELENRKKAN